MHIHNFDRVDAAVAEYLRRTDRGDVVDREQFIVAHHDVAGDLREFFASEDLLRCLIRQCGRQSAACR